MERNKDNLISELARTKSDAWTIATGAAVNFIGTLARLSKTVSVIVLTRLFGAEIFGLYMLGWTIVDMADKFGHFALDRGLINFLPRYHDDGKASSIHQTIIQALGLGLILSTLAGTALFISAPALAEGLLEKPRLTGMLRLLSLAMPLIALTTIILGIAKAHKVMKYDALVKGAIEPIVLFGGACAMFYGGWRTYGIAGAQLVALTGSLLFTIYVFTRFYSWRVCLVHLSEFRIFTPLTRFSFPVMSYELVYMLMIRLDVLMVGYFLPAMQLGIYVVTVEIALATKKVRQWFDPIFSPIIVELNHRKDMQTLEENLRLVTRWVLTISLSFLCSVILIGDELLRLFGPEFGVGFITMVILAISQVVYSAMGSGDTVLIMSGRSYLNLINTIAVVIVNVVLNLWLIPHLGMMGAALGTLISFVLLTVIRLVEVYHLYQIHPLTWRMFKPLAAAIVAFGFAFLVGNLLPGIDVLRMVCLPAVFLFGYLVMLRILVLEESDLLIIQRFRQHTIFKKKCENVN